MIYFTRYVHSKWSKMLNLYYHELMEKTEEHKMVVLMIIC